MRPTAILPGLNGFFGAANAAAGVLVHKLLALPVTHARNRRASTLG